MTDAEQTEMLSFGTMPDDVGKPAALVARTKQDGTIKLIAVNGADDDVNDALLALDIILQLAEKAPDKPPEMSALAYFIAGQKVAIQSSFGIDIGALVQAVKDGATVPEALQVGK